MIQIGQQTIEIWLVRQGQTEGNKMQILQEQDDRQLSVLGIKQAEALGKRIKKENFDLVFVSDLAATKQTFELIQMHHTQQMMPNFEPLLKEKHASVDQYYNLYTGIQFNITKRVNQRESGNYKNNQVKQMLQLIVQRCSNLKQNKITVLLVTHGEFIIDFMSQINYMIYKKQTDYTICALDCSISIVNYTLPKGEVKIVKRNDVSHIQKL